MTKSPQNDAVNVTLGYIQRDVSAINEKLDNNYVTKDDFLPVKNIVYGLTGLILTAAILALLKLIFVK